MPLLYHSRPIFLIHPEPDEARDLQTELRSASADHPVLVFHEADDARDYLNAVLLAQAPGEHYCPCLIFLDEDLPPADVEKFRHWLGSRPELAGIHFVTLSNGPAGGSQSAENSSAIERRPTQTILRRLIARVCPS